MLIENKPLNTIFPYINNPRVNEQTVQKVAASIKEFGFRQPIVVDSNNVVVVGHTRLAAATLLNLETVPVHVAENLTDAQAKAYRIADNRIAEDSKWDYELLALEIADIETIDLSVLGFDPSELQSITGNVGTTEYPKLPDGEKGEYEQITFTLNRDDAEYVRQAVSVARNYVDDDMPDAGVIGIKNGRALAHIIKQWERTLSEPADATPD
jgi:hypothetical protein